MLGTGGVAVGGVTVRFTTSAPVAVLAEKLPCAAYAAASVCVPTDGLATAKVAAPFTNGNVAGRPPSTANDTLPLGMPAVDDTVTATVPLPGAVTAGALIVVVVGTVEGGGPDGVPNTMKVSMSVRVPVAAAVLVASTCTWMVWTPAGRARTYMTRRGCEPAL